MNPAHHALADTLCAALEKGDADTVRTLYAPDIKIWHNFDGLEQDADTNLASLAWMTCVLPELRYDVHRREAAEDGFWQAHTMRGKTKGGTEITMPAAIRFTVVNDRITRIEEYLDPAPLMRALKAEG